MRKSLLLIATAVLAMTACTQDVPEQEGGAPAINGEINVSASIDEDTRTSMTTNGDNLSVSWVAGDGIGMFATDGSGSIGDNVKYTAASNDATSKFTKVTEAIQWGEGTHNFYAYYPYATATDVTAVPIEVPAVQNQSEAGNLDHLQPYAFLYASKTGVSASSSVVLNFKNALSVLEVNLCTARGTINCEGIVFRAEDKAEVLATTGATIDITNGTINTSAATNSNAIKVELATPATLDATTPQSFYMMITPGHAGKRFSIYALVDGREVLLGNKGIPAGGLPAGVKASLDLNVPAIDLSANGTANCYIVNKAGATYKFKATVQGNGQATPGITPVALTPAKAYLMWTQVNPLSSDDKTLTKVIDKTSVTLKDGYVYFNTPSTMVDGNACIAVVDNSNNILWSWHLWCVNGYDAYTSAYTVTNTPVSNGFKMMDRNLGAFSNGSTGTYDDRSTALGMWYQWGRKDPFLGIKKANGYYTTFYWQTIDGTIDKIYTYSGPNYPTVDLQSKSVDDAVAYTVAHPMEFATATVDPYQWLDNTNVANNTEGTAWNKLWGNITKDRTYGKGSKSIYDPCPIGWRVPEAECFFFITAHNDDIGKGYSKQTPWKLNTPTQIYPAANESATFTDFFKTPYGIEFYIHGKNTAGGDLMPIAPKDKTVAYFPAGGVLKRDNGKPGNYNGAGEYLCNNAYNGSVSRRMSMSLSSSGLALFTRSDGETYPQLANGCQVRCIADETVAMPTDQAVDLSAAGTSNCYVVNKPGLLYRFKATVKGNGVATLSGDKTTINPTKARLSWAQNTTTTNPTTLGYPNEYGNTNAAKIIDPSSVTLADDGYIYFKTPTNMPNGNVGIIATDDDDNVLWSWHIWVVNDYDPAATDIYVKTKGVNAYFMDRNIGAFCNYATIDNPDNNDHIASRGLYYQWGRKDPFIGHQSANGYATKALLFNADGSSTATYACYGGGAVFEGVAPTDAANSDNINDIIKWTIANPRKFIKGTNTNGYTWVSTTAGIKATEETEWAKLWGNPAIGANAFDKGGVKTMYDPCPVGYRVPSTGHFIFITSHNDNSSSGYGNNFRNWQFNSVEKIWDADGNATGTTNTGWAKSAPFGLHFYANGVKTASPDATAGVQDDGVLPIDQSVIYFPAQGWIPYGFTCGNNGNEMQYHTNRPAKNNVNCYRMRCSNDGNFYYNHNGIDYGQAMGLPVRCIRE